MTEEERIARISELTTKSEAIWERNKHSEFHVNMDSEDTVEYRRLRAELDTLTNGGRAADTDRRSNAWVVSAGADPARRTVLSDDAAELERSGFRQYPLIWTDDAQKSHYGAIWSRERPSHVDAFRALDELFGANGRGTMILKDDRGNSLLP
jgi:hypothetical protein